MKNKLIIISFSILLSSCLKEEIAIPPHVQGDVISNQVEMGTDYGMQIYFDLETNSVVKTNTKTDWDLSFECSDDGWHILLNSSLGGAAANMNTTDFASVISENNANWNWDHQKGYLDSTAIGDYRGSNTVYIIDRGYDLSGNQIGYKKVVFSQINNQSYEIRVADLDGSNENTDIINKDITVNFIAFSFDSNSTVDIEPNKEDWDILFTQYIHVFSNPTTPYLVTGVLLNRYNTLCVMDTLSTFEQITIDNIPNYTFSSDLNTIGYDWKTYSFSNSNFIVLPEKNYIIKTQIEAYYKLHFIDYYNNLGEKGAPMFELQDL